MANPVIKIKRSAVAGKIPTTTSLELGELAINTYDGKLFIQQDQGVVGVGSTVITINPWSVGVGSIAYNTYFTAGSVGIGTTLPRAALNVVGVVSATSFFGDGANVTGISTLNIVNYGVGLGGGGGESYWISNSAGIHTLSAVGVGTTNPSAAVTSANTTVLAAGIVTAYKFYGDGAGITGISAVARVTVQSGAPSSPTDGDLWYHTTLGRLFVYFDDGNSSQWVDASPFNLAGGDGANVSVGATAPNAPIEGDLWYNSNYGRLFVYYSDEDSDQWVDAAPFNMAGLTTSTTYTENSFTATAGQTTFSVAYDVGYVEVYLNGIRLSSSEYTATSGTSVVLDEPAAEGDVVDIIEVVTNRGPTGPQGPAGTNGVTTLAGVGTTSVSTTHYPVFIAGLGTTAPFISTTSNYFSFIPSSGTLSVNQLNVGVTTLGVTTATNLTVQSVNCSGVVTATNLTVQSVNCSGVVTATNLTVQSVNCSGVVTATDFNSTSDINLKTNIKTIDDSLAKVMQLNGVSFNWIDTGQSSAGVIAQDVEKILPEIIRDNPTGHKSLNYNGLIGLLIEAVKEQNETIKSLEQKINTLEGKLS